MMALLRRNRLTLLKAVIVIVLTSTVYFMLEYGGLFRALRQHLSSNHQEPNNDDYEDEYDDEYGDISPPKPTFPPTMSCGYLNLKSSMAADDDSACQLSASGQEYCMSVQEAFKPYNFSHCIERPLQVCTFEKEELNVVENDEVNFEINCKNFGRSGKRCIGDWALGTVHVTSGGHVTWKHFSTAGLLEAYIAELTESYSKIGLPSFVLLKCRYLDIPPQETTTRPWWEEYETTPKPTNATPIVRNGTQMLIFPPKILTKKPDATKLNLNLLYLPDVSHNNFFRLFPKSVKALGDLQNRTQLQTEVIEYVKFQDLGLGEPEVLQTLLSGGSKANVEKHHFLDLLIEKGQYKPFFINDQCILQGGSHLHPLFKAKVLSKKGRDSNTLKSFLMSNFTSPLLMALCDMRNPKLATWHLEHGENLELCYNGNHHHAYVFDYLSKHQLSMNLAGHHYISHTSTTFMEANQQFGTYDLHLANYLHFAANQKTTVTILYSSRDTLSNPGLAKTVPLYQHEADNPILFFIVPKSISRRLGKNKMAALRGNRKKLVTLLDVHDTLQYLGAFSEVPHVSTRRKGFFEHIDSKRSCKHLQLVKPELCICKTS